MAKIPPLVVSALSTWNGKALAKGKKDISQFDAATQKLGKTFAKVFGTVAVAAFAKNAVNAFIESEKAAAKLRTTVNNLGLAFEQPAIDDYLKRLSLQFGIIDENLIPGFQKLLIATKNVAEAQSIFETALNVSAGTGKDLNTVTTSLSKAYMGDNAALGRLGVGLSKAQLKSASFLDIQKQLNVNFAGQASAAVSGYAGDMAKLTVAVDEAKESIGKGLLDALKALSGDTSIDTFTNKLVTAADTLARYITNVAEFLSLLNPNTTEKIGGRFVRKSDQFTPFGQAGSAQNKVIKQGTTLRKLENDQIKAKTELEKLKEKYDVERIGLMLALNTATDEETRLRIAEKLAILDGNAAKAKEYVEIGNATMMRYAEIESLKDLTAAQYLAATQMTKLADWAAYRAGERASAAALAATGGAATAGGMSFSPAPTMTMASDYAAYRAGERGDVIVNVAGSVLTEQDLTDTIQRTILQINKQGRGTTPAGGLSGGT
jgi:hypothetical protein